MLHQKQRSCNFVMLILHSEQCNRNGSSLLVRQPQHKQLLSIPGAYSALRCTSITPSGTLNFLQSKVAPNIPLLTLWDMYFVCLHV